MKIKVILKGSYGEGNFGDDALMFACVQILKERYSCDEIAIISKNKDIINTILPDIPVINPLLPGFCKFELLLYGGGTQFCSFPLTTNERSRKSVLKRLCRGFASPRKLYYYVLDKILPFDDRFKKRAALSVGLGPFVSNSQDEYNAQNIFKKLHYIAVRDTASLQLCQEWGAVATLRSDICFADGLWHYSMAIDKKPCEKRIAVIIRDWPHTSEGAGYIHSLVEAVQHLRSAGFIVEYISLCENADPKWMEIFNKNNEKCITWDSKNNSIDEFLELLSAYSCIITARYHGAVFGVLLGIPVICVEVEQKLELFSMLLSGYTSLWKQPFDTLELVQAIYHIDTNNEAIIRGVNEVKMQQSQLAMSMVNEFRNFVNIIGK